MVSKSKYRTRRNNYRSKRGKYKKVRKTQRRTRRNRQRGGSRFWSNLGEKTRRFVRSTRSRFDKKYRAKLEAEKAEADRLVAEKAEADRLAAEKAEADRLAAAKRKEREEKEAIERRARQEKEYYENLIERKKMAEQRKQQRPKLQTQLELLISIAEKEKFKLDKPLEYLKEVLKDALNDAKVDFGELIKLVSDLYEEIAKHIIKKEKAKYEVWMLQRPFYKMMWPFLTKISESLKLNDVKRSLNVTIKGMQDALSDPKFKSSLRSELGNEELVNNNLYILKYVIEECIDIKDKFTQQNRCKINGYLPIKSKVVIISQDNLFGKLGTIMEQMKDTNTYNILLERGPDTGFGTRVLLKKDEFVCVCVNEKLMGEIIWKNIISPTNIRRFPNVIPLFEKINKYYSGWGQQMKQKLQNMSSIR